MRTKLLYMTPLIVVVPIAMRLYSAPPPIPEGDYMVRNASNTLVLDDPFSSRESGEQIIRWNWNRGLNQKWHFAYHGGGHYTIQNVKSGLFLTDPGGPVLRNVPLQQQSARNDASQLWRLYRTGSSFKISNKARHLLIEDPGVGSSLGTGIVLVSGSGAPDGNVSWTIRKDDNSH